MALTSACITDTHGQCIGIDCDCDCHSICSSSESGFTAVELAIGLGLLAAVLLSWTALFMMGHFIHKHW